LKKEPKNFSSICALVRRGREAQVKKVFLLLFLQKKKNLPSCQAV